MWTLRLLVASLALVAVASSKLIVVTPVDYDDTTASQARAAEQRVIGAIAALGYPVRQGSLICDDPNAGAERLHATYYVLISPNPNWNRISLQLFRVGNDHPLRSVIVAKVDALAPGVDSLMDNSRWAVAYSPHHGC